MTGELSAIPIMEIQAVFPSFFFMAPPGSRILGLEDEPLIEEYRIRVIAPERPG